MKTHIILLRGVTPTGKNKLLMAPLREALTDAGLSDVQTYIQSGNVIAKTALSHAAVETLVHDVIADAFGGDISVISRAPEYFQAAIEQCPFENADPKKLYFSFLAESPDSTRVEEFLTIDFGPDQVRIVGDIVYLLFATKFSDGKINNSVIERKLKVSATTRVLRTVENLLARGIADAGNSVSVS